MNEDLIAELIEAGTPAGLVAKVAMALGRAEVDRQAIENRRASDRARKATSEKAKNENLNSRELTSYHVPEREAAEGKSQTAAPFSSSEPIPPSPPKGAHPPLGERVKRASHIDENWKPTEANRERARQLGFSEIEIDAAAREFVGYWRCEGGQRARKRDWPGTFDNRIDELASRRHRINGARAGPPPPRPARVDNRMNAVNEILDFVRDQPPH